MEDLKALLHRYILQEDNTIIFLGRVYKPGEILRMVIILGGYLLLRPYILKMQAKFQERDHAREIDPTEESSHAAMGARRRKPAGEETDDEDDDSWGAKLKRKQKAEALAKAKLLEEENDSDDEIAEYLDKE